MSENESVDKRTLVIERIRRLDEKRKEYSKKYLKQRVIANTRYMKRQRIIAKLLLANPNMSFEEARNKAFEQVPTPSKPKEVSI